MDERQEPWHLIHLSHRAEPHHLPTNDVSSPLAISSSDTAMANNPPQLQLQLGHQTFKRSFHQFGLDVDDAEDSEAGAGSSGSSSSSTSRSGSASGSTPGSSGSRSVSSGSSYSSPGGDGFGYNDGERGERNKRARSEGPEGTGINTTSSLNTEEQSLPTRTRPDTFTGIFNSSSQGQQIQASASSASSHQLASNNTATSGFTLPELNFEPSTPSMSEFVALRTSASNGRPPQHPPGFAGMLSPRSSSPAPPPVEVLDVAMRDDADDDSLMLNDSRTGRQNSSSNAFLDTARSDALLNSATARLRSAMERARTFDRMLAPLRTDAADGLSGTSHSPLRPRLPSFEFEARRRMPFPLHGDGNTISNPAIRSPFHRSLHQSSTADATTSGFAMRHRSSLSRRSPIVFQASGDRSPSPDLFSDVLRRYSSEDDELADAEDDLVIDRELYMDSDQQNSPRFVLFNSEAIPSGARNTSSLNNRDGVAEDTSRRDFSSRALDDRVRAINSLTTRTIDDLTSFISTSEAEDDARTSRFDNSYLDPTLAAGMSDGINGIHPVSRAQSNMYNPQSPPHFSARHSFNTASGPDGLGSPGRSIPYLNTSQDRVRNRAEGVMNRSGLNTRQNRDWPWAPLDLEPMSGLESGYRSEASRMRPLPQSPSSQFPLSASPARNTEDEHGRVGRTVQSDTQNDLQRLSNIIRRAREGHNPLAQPHSENAQRSSPVRQPPRPNLPALRSALLGPHGSAGLLGSLLEEERARNGNTGSSYSSASAISPSMSSSGLRSRVTHSERFAEPNALHSADRSTDRLHEPMDTISSRFRLNTMPPTSSFAVQSSSSSIRDANRHGMLPPSRMNEGTAATENTVNFTSSRFNSQTAQLRDTTLEMRQRRLLSDLVSRSRQTREESRNREMERTRLGEMREQNRLPIRRHSSFMDGWEDHLFSPREESDLLHWAYPWDEFLTSAMSPAETVPMTEHLRREASSSDIVMSTSNEPTTSTEAAAFFASGISNEPARQLPGNPSSVALRQRRARLLTDVEGQHPHSPSQSWPDLDQRVPVGVSSDFLSRSPSLEFGPERIRDTNEDIRRMRYLSHRPPVSDAGENSSTMENLNRDNSPENPRNGASLDAVFDSIDSSIRTSPLFQERSTVSAIALRHALDTATVGSQERSTLSRSGSRPPSLPPLRFQRSPPTLEDYSSFDYRRLSTSEEVMAPRQSAGRRLNSRINQQPEVPSPNTSARPVPHNDIAMHHAMTLRSVQARQGANRTSQQGLQRPSTLPAAPPSSSTQSEDIRHTLDRFLPDTLSTARRQQTSTFDRGRDRDRNRLSRPETHARWGEIVDNDAGIRPLAHPPRPWRRSTSALFAPPPENADNAPPNRSRGSGTAAADPSTQAETAAPDWLSSMVSSSSRSRFRRARFGRSDEETASRSFFRFGRRAPGLRNMGDFVRDEDFDTSYESLLALAATLGDVKPRSTPADVLRALPTGLYKEWQSPGCDLRCPICLDDYEDADELLKAEPCNHWCHQGCLEQWLHTAQTCPVCRTKIKASSQRSPTPPPVAGPSRMSRNDSSEDFGDDSDDDLSVYLAVPERLNRMSMMGYFSSGNPIRYPTTPPSPPSPAI